ncbi:MAG TPA: MFS transporter [Polyangiaceae bacterium]|nr:MFS transporter [Polyangiaceae bacterium]
MDQLAAPRESRLWSPAFLRIVAAQGAFGFAWCSFLLQPKFFTGPLGVGPREVGFVNATSGVASVAAIAVLVSVVDRRGGRRAAFIAGALLLFACSLGYLAVDRFGPLVFLLQAGVAASYVLSFNAAMALVTDVAPAERLGQGFGLQSAANLSMNAVATTTTEAISEHFGWHSIYGLAAVAALLCFLVGLGLPAGRAHAEGPTDPPPVRALLPIFITSAFLGAAFSSMFVFHQPYAVSLGAKRVGTFFVGFTAAALLMRLGFGSLGDRLGRKRTVLVSLVLYTLVPLSMSRLSTSVLWAYGAGLGIAHGVAYPTLTALAAERTPDSARGRAIALFSGAFSIGSSGGALAWGQVAAHAGYPVMFVCSSACVLLALLTLVGLRDETAS